MSWRDGTSSRTAKSIAQLNITTSYTGPTAQPQTGNEIKTRSSANKKTSVKVLEEDNPPSPDSPLKCLASIVLQDNENELSTKKNSKKRPMTDAKESNVPRKKKRIRAPSPPKMKNWTQTVSRNTNTSGSTNYFGTYNYLLLLL